MDPEQLKRSTVSTGGNSPTHPPQSFPLVQTVLIAVAIVVALFILYEVIERVWLVDLDMETRHTLHRLRGMLAALVELTFIGWVVLRWSQPLLDRALSSEQWQSGVRPGKTERNIVYARWFIHMRWIAVLVAAILIVATVQFAELLPPETLWPLLATVSLLAGLNLIYTMLLRTDSTNPHLLSGQAYVDLALFVVLLHFSGGVENPLAPLMIFHVIIAGIVLSQRQCFAVAAFGCILFTLLVCLEFLGFLTHYTLQIFPHLQHEGEIVHAAHSAPYVASEVVLQSAVMLLTAFFVTAVADRLRKEEIALELFAERMLTQRQLLEQSLETTHTGLCVFDRNLEPVWQNSQWISWFGSLPTNSLLYQQICGADSEAGKTIEDGQIRVIEISQGSPPNSVVVGDHDLRTFQATTAALLDQDNEVSSVVQMVHDISEQKRTQAGLVQAGKLAAVGEMAGEVAHEVNNPIAIIGAKSRLLIANHRADMSEKIAEELAKIIDLADRVAKVVQGVLTYSRPSAGLRERIDIRRPIRKAIELAEQRAHTFAVKIENRLPDHPLVMEANANELEQVFFNLLINSLDAMDGGGQITVSAGLVADGSDHEPLCEILVEDTGHGITPEIKRRAFEPFFSTKAEGDGTGLGLSICLGLVQSHGGSIDLTSEPGKWTRVTVRLPIDASTTGVDQDV